MTWKIVRREPTCREKRFSGVCPKTQKRAEVTLFYTGIKQARTDCQLTYHYSGCKCSLLTGDNANACEECPLVPSEYFVEPL